MKNIIKWCSWELKNEFYASGYFSTMLAWYCILKLINREYQVDIIILLQMFVVNYIISTLQRFVLDDRKEYTKKTYLLRGGILSVISLILVLIMSELGEWFEGLPSWSGIITYSLLITAYLTVWIVMKLEKKYDTQELNQQLATFKKVKGED